MGEEQKKPDKLDNPDPEKKEDASKDQKPLEDAKKDDDKNPQDSKETNPPPPPPPPEIVLRVYMHCEGCARKVRRCLKGFDGVEDVATDCRTSKVVVKGEKADPVKVLERIQRKSHRQVELISPIPKPPPSEDQPKKPEEKPTPKIEEKKEELPVITVVLRVYMHCEACAQEIKKRILRMKGVESAEPELKSSQVSVKGAFLAEKLAHYVYKRTGKHSTIVKVEPEKKEEEKGKEEKKAEEKGKEVSKTEEEPSKETSGGGGEPPAAVAVEDIKQRDMKRNEHFYDHMNYSYYYNHQIINPPQGFHVQEYYNYRPDQRFPSSQIFSDENPNACSVM